MSSPLQALISSPANGRENTYVTGLPGGQEEMEQYVFSWDKDGGQHTVGAQ